VSAGLPGLGLGGLFFILSALVAPILELVRTVRGESDAASWRRVGRNFALAVVMIAAVDVTLRLAYLGLDVTGLGDPAPAAPTALPLVPIGITAGLLAAVVGSAKAMQLAASARSRGIPPLPVPAPLPGRVRALAGGFAVAAAWFALLLFGASQLSPVSDTGSAPAAVAHDRAAEPDDAPTPKRTSVAASTATGIGQREHVIDGSRLTAGSVPPLGASTPSPEPRSSANLPGTSGAGPADPAPVAVADAVPHGQTESPGAVPGPSAAAGPPGHAGPPAHAASGAQSGPPDHAGPPEHAGPPAKGDHQTVGSTRNSTRVP
jgi:hypothetical protein